MFDLTISHARFYKASIIANEFNTSFTTIDVRSIPPEIDWIKVNMDNSDKGNPDKTRSR